MGSGTGGGGGGGDGRHGSGGDGRAGGARGGRRHDAAAAAGAGAQEIPIPATRAVRHHPCLTMPSKTHGGKNALAATKVLLVARAAAGCISHGDRASRRPLVPNDKSQRTHNRTRS